MGSMQSAEQDKKNKGESSTDNNDQGEFKRPLKKWPLAGTLWSFSVFHHSKFVFNSSLIIFYNISTGFFLKCYIVFTQACASTYALDQE